MNRIISKIDYDMHELGQVNPCLILKMWNKIKDKKFVLDKAIEIVVDKEGKKCFFAPAICYMILSNPKDIDKNLYDNLVLDILKNDDLNKLVVFNNISFFNLILLNFLSGRLEVDEFFSKLISKIVEERIEGEPCLLRYPIYQEVPISENKIVNFKDYDFDISLSKEECDVFDERTHFDIETRYNIEEINNIVSLANFSGNFDERIRNTVFRVYATLFAQIRYNETVKRELLLNPRS